MDVRLRMAADSGRGHEPVNSIVSVASELSITAARLAELLDGNEESSSPTDVSPKRTARELRNLAAATSGIDTTFRRARFGQSPKAGAPLDGVVAAIGDVFTDCEDTLAHLETILSKYSRQGGLTKSILRRRPSVKLDFRLPEVAFIMQQISTYIKSMNLAWLVLNSLLEVPRERLPVPEIDGSRRAVQMAKSDLLESMSLSQEMETQFSTSPEARLVLTDNRRKRQTLDRFVRASDTHFLDVEARRASFDSHADNRRSLYQESIFSSLSGTSSVSEPIVERPISQAKLSPLIGGGSPEDEADYDRMMLNRRLKLAEVDMQNRQYKRAEAQFRKCVKDLESGDQQELIDVKMRLAVACYGQQKGDEAKQILESLLEGQVSKHVSYSIKHDLADLHLIEGNLEAAEKLAQAAVRGRGILYGSDHILYHQSANLLANIVTTMGDEDEARIYESYLPADFVPAPSMWILSNSAEKLVVPLELGSPKSPLKTPPQPQILSSWGGEPEEKILLTPEETPNNWQSLNYPPEQRVGMSPTHVRPGHFSIASYPPEEKIVVTPDEMPLHRLSLGNYPPEEKIAVTSPTTSEKLGRNLSVSKHAAVESGKLLVKAATEGNVDAVAALIAGGASLSEGDSLKWTALMWAAWEGHDAVLELLLKAGASPEQVDLDGRTPLMLASTAGHIMVTETLLLTGAARIDSRSNVGRTALMYAAAKGHDHVCRLLVAKGAVITDKDNLGRTAITHAKSGKNPSLVKFLKARAKD